MDNPYLDFVTHFSSVIAEGGRIPLGTVEREALAAADEEAPVAMIFSPHPDDEAISGGLALRLARESGWRVQNVAVTLGSKRERRAERSKELEACCKYLGFELISTGPVGLEHINLKEKVNNPGRWNEAVGAIASLLVKTRPSVIFMPHAQDWNITHIGTHALVMDALERQSDDFFCRVVETEFWGAMDSPNLMVELDEKDLAELVTGLSHHVGEVTRNPYHLSLPAWMADNVRRGGEILGGQGAAVPAIRFATLYRLSRWGGGRLVTTHAKGQILAKGRAAAELFHQA